MRRIYALVSGHAHLASVALGSGKVWRRHYAALSPFFIIQRLGNLLELILEFLYPSILCCELQRVLLFPVIELLLDLLLFVELFLLLILDVGFETLSPLSLLLVRLLVLQNFALAFVDNLQEEVLH